MAQEDLPVRLAHAVDGAAGALVQFALGQRLFGRGDGDGQNVILQRQLLAQSAQGVAGLVPGYRAQICAHAAAADVRGVVPEREEHVRHDLLGVGRRQARQEHIVYYCCHIGRVAVYEPAERTLVAHTQSSQRGVLVHSCIIPFRRPPHL